MSKHSKPKECREERETNKANGNNTKSDLLSKKQQTQQQQQQQQQQRVTAATRNNQQNYSDNSTTNHLSKNKLMKSSANVTSNVNSNNEDWPTINETFKATTTTTTVNNGDLMNNQQTVVTTTNNSSTNNNNNSDNSVITSQSTCSLLNQEMNNNMISSNCNKEKMNIETSNNNNNEKVKNIGKGVNNLKINDSQKDNEKKLRNNNTKDILMNNVNISNIDKLNNNNIYRKNSNDGDDEKEDDLNNKFTNLVDDNEVEEEEEENCLNDNHKKLSDDCQSYKEDLLSNEDQAEDESTTDNKDDLNSSSGASASGGCNDSVKESSNNNNNSLGSTANNKKKGTKQRWRPLIIEPQPKRDQDRRRGPKSYRRRGSSLSEHTDSRRFSTNNQNNNSNNNSHYNSSSTVNNDENVLSIGGMTAVEATTTSPTNINKPSMETKSYRGSRRGRGRYAFQRSHYQRTRSYDFDTSNIQIDTTTNVPCYSNTTLLECEPLIGAETSVPLNSPSTMSSSSDYKSITPYLIAGPAPAATARILQQPNVSSYYIPGYHSHQPYTGNTALPTSIPAAGGTVDIYKLIRSQVEYYFSDENLQRDFFLRRKMDSEGYLPIHLIASFQRVQALTQDLNVLISALRASKEVEFSDDCMRIRTTKNPLQWPVNDALSGASKETNFSSSNNNNYTNGYFASDLHPDVPAFIPGQPYGYGYDGAPTTLAYNYKANSVIVDKESSINNVANVKEKTGEKSCQQIESNDDGIDADNETDNDPNELQQQSRTVTNVSCYADVLKL